MQGYIKDHRKELNSDIWEMPPLYHRVWQWLKYKANHEDASIPMSDGTKFVVRKGQHLTSVRNIAQGVGWYEGMVRKEPNPKTISTILDWLVKNNMIEIDRGRGNRQYTLITIVNWEFYQGSDGGGVTADGEARKQQTDINKNEKNDKKKTSSSKKSPTYSEGSTYLKMARYFFDKVKAVAEAEGLTHLIIKADMQKWADEFRKLWEIDKVQDKRLIADVIDWVTSDSFWRTNVLSAKKLREKFGELALKMRGAQKPKQQLQQRKSDSREKEIEFQRWIKEGNSPDDFDWSS